MKALAIFLTWVTYFSCEAQNVSLLKIKHAEPLYVDLIRDLGARKGEREWNLGWGLNDNRNFISYSGFIEYEFAPANRLGFEVEVPFSFYHTNGIEDSQDEVPHHRLDGIKTAIQYTCWVSSKYKTSVALGYMNELKLHSFKTMFERTDLIKGNVYNPFFIVAKRWGAHLHSLLYTGPVWEQEFVSGDVNCLLMFNASVHYVIPGTSHFFGVEWNQELGGGDRALTVVRPQAKLKLFNGLSLGMLTGIPLSFDSQRISFMARLIYEPQKKAK